MADSVSRKLLFRWAGWFALVNSALFGVVSLRYFSGGVPAESFLSVLYLVYGYIGHQLLFNTVPIILIATPRIMLFTSRRVINRVALGLFYTMVAFMILDNLLW